MTFRPATFRERNSCRAARAILQSPYTMWIGHGLKSIASRRDTKADAQESSEKIMEMIRRDPEGTIAEMSEKVVVDSVEAPGILGFEGSIDLGREFCGGE